MFDDILTVLSVFGKISFNKFNEIYDVLLKVNFKDDEDARLKYSYKELMRDLESLGHCEIDYLHRQVFICPPAFTLLPIRGLPVVLLTGGRTNEMINKLNRIAQKNPELISVQISTESSRNQIFPSAIYVESKSKNILKQLADKLGADFQDDKFNARKILAVTDSINEVSKSLVFSEMEEINWHKREFSHNSLYFKEVKSNDGIKLVNYKNPFTQQQYTFIWNGQKAAQVDKNWGRYLILNYYQKEVLLYDDIRMKFAVPSTLPLPTLLKKVLVLCTGRLPQNSILHKKIGSIEKDTNITVYNGIPDFIAEDISMKLGLDLLQAHL